MPLGDTRAVIYTAPAADTLDEMPADHVDSVRTDIEAFLAESEDVFDSNVADAVHRIECGSYNALATQCINSPERRDVCVIHQIYLRTNESEYFEYLDEYSGFGQDLQAEIVGIDQLTIDRWLRQKREQPDAILVES